MLLNYVFPTMMAAFLYLGAGLGMLVYSMVSKAAGKASPSEPLTKKELPFTIAMVVLDIIAPILLMFGIKSSHAANVSLINNFEIVVIKGTFSGLGSLAVAFVIGESIPSVLCMICVLLLGFVAYGLSIYFYVMAQKDLGAAKTSAYYSIAPFLGVASGMLILGERPAIQFYAGLIVMIVSTYFMIKDTVELQHTHEHSHTHTHEHRHRDLVHTHEHTHTHTHIHVHTNDIDNHEHNHKAMPHEHLHIA